MNIAGRATKGIWVSPNSSLRHEALIFCKLDAMGNRSDAALTDSLLPLVVIQAQ
jgi:hypothetical protein